MVASKKQKHTQLALSTLVVVDELPDGTCLVYPVVEPQTIAAGLEDNALTELRLFLSEDLQDAEAERIARFSLPEDAFEQTFQIELPQHDVPKNMRQSVRVPVQTVVVPHGDARWVLIPALKHTIYVSATEALEDIVASELERHLLARQPDAFARLSLFVTSHLRVERIAIHVDLPAALADGTRALRSKLATARKRRHALDVLASVGVAVHDESFLAGPPVVGRTNEIAALDALLTAGRRQSVLLVGPERVGKTSVLLEWLRTKGESQRVFGTSGAQLIAGMSGLGQWQARVQRVVEAAETLDAILYFDDLRDLFDQRGASGVDIPAAMKSAIEEGRIRIVGELTEEAADLLSSQREGFFQSLHTIRVPTLDRAVSATMLAQRAEYTKTHRDHLPEVQPSALEAMLALCERYLPYRPFPGKAAELFDQVVQSAERPGVVLDAESEIRASDVYRLFSIQSGIPEFLLRDDRSLDPARLTARFQSRLIGQTNAVSAVVDTLCVVKAGLQPAEKPLATFLFVGPTGVGKTELARALAEILYGAEDRLIRFDMSEYADPSAAQRLIAGGDGGRDGLLTRKVREQPFAVILLDEIEKAHPSVFDLLLQVTGEGRLTDARGRTAFFQNSIVIMTSNLGATHRRTRVGIESAPDLEGHYLDEVRKWFRPEFVGRLDRVIPFRPLDRDEVRTIATLMLERIRGRRGLQDRGSALELTDAALTALAEGGFHEAYGARALRRHAEEALVAPIATAIAHAPRGAQLHVRLEDEPPPGEPLQKAVRNGLVVEVLPAEHKVSLSELQVLNEVLLLRRQAGQWMELPAVEAHREEMFTTLARLSMPRSKKEQARAGQEMARLQHRHAQLSASWAPVQAVRDEIHDLEELVFAAWMERDRYEGAKEEIVRLRHEMRMALFQIYLELDAQHEATAMLVEQDEGRTLEHWLLPLYADAERRGWEIAVHRFKDPIASPDWPKERGFGPPRTRAEITEWLQEPARDRAVLLMRVRGRHAGTQIAAEKGLHRFLGVPPKAAGAHHMVKLLSMRFDLKADDWLRGPMQPDAPGVSSALLKGGCTRYTDERPDQKLPDAYVEVPLDQYWSPFNADELCLRELITLDISPNRDRSGLCDAPLDRGPKSESEANA